MVNLTLPKELVDRAHELDVNLSYICRKAVRKEIKEIEAEGQSSRTHLSAAKPEGEAQ